MRIDCHAASGVLASEVRPPVPGNFPISVFRLIPLEMYRPDCLPSFAPRRRLLDATVSFGGHGVQRGYVGLGEGDALREQLQPGDGQAEFSGEG